MAEEAKWYVAHTYSGYENKVKANIEKSVENRGMQDLILDVKVPTEEVVEENGDKKKVVQHKIFPGYVIIKMIMTDESWYIVRNTRGVTGFVVVIVFCTEIITESLFRFRTKKLNAWVLKLFV